MLKSEFDICQPRQLFQRKKSSNWVKSTNTCDDLNANNSETKGYQRSSNQREVKFDQFYLDVERQFNHTYTEQLKINEDKFNKKYHRILQKLEQSRTQVPEQVKFQEAGQLIQPFESRRTCVKVKYQRYETERLVQSQHRISGDSPNKVSQKEQSTQLSIKPLRIRHLMEDQGWQKRRVFNQQEFGQMEDNPSSCRTIIKELLDLLDGSEDRE